MNFARLKNRSILLAGAGTAAALLQLSVAPRAAADTKEAWRTWTTAGLVQAALQDVFEMPIDAHVFNYAPTPKQEQGKYFDPLADWTTPANATTAAAFPLENPRWKHRNFVDWYGFGHYAALDPVVSRGYGSPGGMANATDYTYPWTLRRFTLPKGARILDIVRKTPLSPVLIEALATRYGCAASTVEELFLMNNNGLKDCRQFVRPVIDGLGITALLYPWWGGRNTDYRSYCDRNRKADVGFLITGALPPGSVRKYTSVLPESGSDGAQEDRFMIREVYLHLGLGGQISARPGLPWPELDDPLSGQRSTDEYQRDHLFGCGPLPTPAVH